MRIRVADSGRRGLVTFPVARTPVNVVNAANKSRFERIVLAIKLFTSI